MARPTATASDLRTMAAMLIPGRMDCRLPKAQIAAGRKSLLFAHVHLNVSTDPLGLGLGRF